MAWYDIFQVHCRRLWNVKTIDNDAPGSQSKMMKPTKTGCQTWNYNNLIQIIILKVHFCSLYQNCQKLQKFRMYYCTKRC